MLGQALALFPLATQSLNSTPHSNPQTWVTQCPEIDAYILVLVNPSEWTPQTEETTSYTPELIITPIWTNTAPSVTAWTPQTEETSATLTC